MILRPRHVPAHVPVPTKCKLIDIDTLFWIPHLPKALPTCYRLQPCPPNTPSCSHSTSTSPASSFSSPTPPDVQNCNVKIMDSVSSGIMSRSLTSDVVAVHPALSIPTAKHKGYFVQDSAASTPLSAKVPSKSKPGRDQYAFATRTIR
jgi:hypothetical protein